MTKLDLSNKGNFPGYKHEGRLVLPEGLITTPELVLKLYAMIKGEHPYPRERVDGAREFVVEEINQGRISPDSGLGFAILSGDNLNVARWVSDPKHPYLPKNTLYEYDGRQEDYRGPRELDIRKEGAFCGFEIIIAEAETLKWFRYLNSNRSEKEKRRYLTPAIEGMIGE